MTARLRITISIFPFPWRVCTPSRCLKARVPLCMELTRSVGFVDFLTAAPDHNSLMVRAAPGVLVRMKSRCLPERLRGSGSGRLSASRNFSTGFMADRDYRNQDGSAESWLGTRLGITDLLFASSDRSFGANQFLRTVQLMGADEGLVRVDASGVWGADRGGLRLSAPHR